MLQLRVLSLLDGIIDSMDMSLNKDSEDSEDSEEQGILQSMGSQRVRHDLATKQQMLQLRPSTTKYIFKNWGKKESCKAKGQMSLLLG